MADIELIMFTPKPGSLPPFPVSGNGTAIHYYKAGSLGLILNTSLSTVTSKPSLPVHFTLKRSNLSMSFHLSYKRPRLNNCRLSPGLLQESPNMSPRIYS